MRRNCHNGSTEIITLQFPSPHLSPHLPYTHTEESPCEDIMRGCQFTSQEVYHAGTLNSESGLWNYEKNKFLLFKPPNL